MNRYRYWATGALAAATLMLLAAYPWRDTLWGGLFTHAGMAALVGGLADWYAVTALFRRPLGIAWQTEWIPRSREKIIHLARKMVTDEILTVPHMYRALRLQSPFQILLALVDEEKVRWRAAVREWLLTLPQYMDEELFRREWETRLTKAAHTVEPADLLAISLRTMLAGGVNSPLWQFLATTAQTAAAMPQAATWAKETYLAVLRREEEENAFRAGVWDTVAAWNDWSPEDVGYYLQEKLIDTVATLHEEDSVLTLQLRARLAAMADRLEHDETWRRALREFFAPFIDSETERYSAVNLRALLFTPERTAELADQLLGKADRYWYYFRRDAERQRVAERALFKYIARMLPRLQVYFGDATERELSRYSGEEMAELVEAEVSNDLQIIRLNGTLIGGVLGATFHLLAILLQGGGLG